MFRVLIVDDEYLLCEHIKRTIDWDVLDMEVVGMANDGEQALVLADSLAPDIILTDIYMPNMNGLELAKRLRSAHPEIAILIITGYSEFKYAQNAIKYGVKHYLLKPIDKESYTEALRLVAEELSNRDRNAERIHEAENEQKNRRLWRTVRSFCHGETDFTEYQTAMGELGHKPVNGTSLLLVMKYKAIENPEEPIEQDKLPQIIRQMFNELLPQPREALLTFDENSAIAIWPMNDISRDDIIAVLERLCVRLEQESSIALFVGVSSVFHQSSDIPNSYKQARNALDSKFVFANCKVIACESVRHDDAYSLSRYLDVQRMLIDLRTNNRDDLLDGENGVYGIFQRLEEDGASRENILFTVMMLASTVNEFLIESSMTSVGLSSRELMNEISSKESVSELQIFACVLVDKALSDTFTKSNPHKFQRTKAAKQYIGEHITDPDLSLSTVAEAVFMNKSYLSDLFKKETGITMVDYINQNRLMYAKKLLDRYPEKSMAIIADESGFGNEYYFIRCFKKQFGITPGSYAKQKSEEDRFRNS